jgi:hypothetical protein
MRCEPSPTSVERAWRKAVAADQLKEPFRAIDVNAAINIDFADVFLPKHRVSNPGDFTELFVQNCRGLYSLK